jgi:hypothetical protein
VKPIPAGPQPGATAAKAITKEKLGSVRLSMDTLKHASMVEYFSGSSSSR